MEAVEDFVRRLGDLEALVAWLRPLYDDWGYVLVLAGAYFENTLALGLFFPGGVMVLLGALYSRVGTLSSPIVLVLATVGTTTGVFTDFLIGRSGLFRAVEHTWFGRPMVRHVPRARRFFERHSPWAVFLAHFAGQVRSALALTAGISGFSWKWFVWYELMGAFSYNLLYCSLGYVLAENLHRHEIILRRIGLGAWVVIGVLVLLWLWRHWYRTRSASTEPSV